MPPKKKLPNVTLETKLQQPEQEPVQQEVTDKPVIHRHRRTRAEIEADLSKNVFTTEANPLFIPLLKVPFELWSSNLSCDDLKLTEQEAQQLALPVTQLANYYFPKIPQIGIAWANLVITSYGLMSARLMIVKKLKEAKKKEQPPQEEQPAQ